MEKNMIRAILAHDVYWGIGKNGDLPWPTNSDDLKWFKESTTGSTIVMGRNTWESLPFKPLPNRHNIVVSNTLKTEACEVVKPNVYLSRLKEISETSDVWIIGGAQLLESSLGIIDELWLNDVSGDYQCDTFLPIKKIQTLFKINHTQIRSFGVVSTWVKRTIK